MKLTFSLLFCLWAFGPWTQAQSTADSLTTELEQLSQQNDAKGFAIAILNKEGITYKKGFGYADEATQKPYTIQSVQPIASISKTLIGVSLMKAQEQGKLQLDDDINQYLPFKITNPNFPDQKISIRHLATHSSSLKDSKHYEKAYIFKEKLPPAHKQWPLGFQRLGVRKMVKTYNRNKSMPLEEFLKNIYAKGGKWYSKKKSFHNKAPGTNFDYSNNGAAIAALILEKATGMNYQEYVLKNIVEPLGMTSSGWSWDQFEESQKSTLYLRDQRLPEYRLITYADGGFITCVEDFSKYFYAIIRGYLGEESVLLQKASFQELVKSQINPSFESGLFWELPSKNQAGHSGGDPGVVTFAYFNKKTGYANIVFFNTSETKNLGKDINDIFRVLRKYGERL
ncbi:MAG: serine hydrolase domain-containing protein [Bacteroidota bacterium]